jgi:hypothetical protein
MVALKTLLARGALRASIVLVAVVAWLAVSNHCALAALAGSAKMPSTHSCHGMKSGDAPSKQKQGGDVECCKVLRATLTKSSTLAASNASAFALQRWFAEPMSFLQPARSRPPLELDIGPPFRESFAETVLQRSILAHAPPSFA